MADSFLERYQRGKHEQVWAELLTLGHTIQDEPLYSDAYAVARETMRRVRRNIEILIPRLRDLGYEFGYAWATRFSPAERLEMEQDEPFFAAPSPDIAQEIDELERRAGTLPLSLRAFYKIVGEVNFIGSHPTWKYEKLDPLEVLSPRMVLKIDDWNHWSDDKVDDGSCDLPIAPDEYFKYFISGAGPYAVRCPNLVADGPFRYEWHKTTFVNYLRICFRWGGFPGWERIEQRSEQELSFLTTDLLAI